MRYSIDLNRVPLDEYLALLQRQTLFPSRRILKDGADQKFARIRAQGVSSVAQQQRLGERFDRTASSSRGRVFCPERLCSIS